MTTINKLYYGDNLTVLREHVPSESVDLIYLDPPFNSNRSYNVLFKEANDSASDAQIAAFDDSWHWGPAAEETLREIETTAQPHVVEMIQAIVRFVGRNDVTAYLVMMTVRLIELHRALKPSGSIYLHCDPTASHYLKVVMDAIFGARNFRNEVTWKRTFAHGNVGQNYGSVADIILWYTASDKYCWNQPFASLSEDEIRAKYPHVDPDGRRWQSVTLRNPGIRPNLRFPYTASNGVTYQPHPNGWSCNFERLQRYDREGRLHFPQKPGGALRLKMYADESPGERLQNIWSDISPIGAQAAERLGYPTQKPLALLERIVQASSNPGDLVLDPFCGCGTTICAAQKLGRRWIGIDITHLAIALMRERLNGMFGDAAQYEVIGQPADVASAEALARQDRYQFQCWALSLIKARPAQEKKGADRGVDGLLFFVDEARAPAKKVMVQVKSGHVQASIIRDLGHVVEREKAVMGFLVSMEQPTRAMLTEALAAGYYHSPGWNRDYPKLQARTIEQLLRGEWFEFPQANVTLAQAERVKGEAAQKEMF